MSEYKRLTKKDKYGHWYTETKINDRFMWSKDGKVWERDLSHYAFDGEAIDRLAELEDKIENGMLIELPCKDSFDITLRKALELAVSDRNYLAEQIYLGTTDGGKLSVDYYIKQAERRLNDEKTA